ncbi:MAG: hypothetical protein KIT09_07815 [Bryobacteraceae bacterium]|nr:hypothetical protein [Bryobacteraceae bacterium]
MTLGMQISWLFVLAIPVACITWTFTHEEIFREPREYCARRSRSCRWMAQRKFFYALTCEYCLSHYVAALFLLLTGFTLLLEGWRGYLIGGFSLVWLANLYMSLFGRLRLDIKSQRIEIKKEEEQLAAGERDEEKPL